MLKNLFKTLASFTVVGICIFGVGMLAEPSTGIHSLDAASPCPATSCASGECHGFDNIPLPDGAHEMSCPEATCSSVDCHAWDALIDRYRQASDASMNLWIVFPVVFVVALVLIVKKVGSRHG